MEFAGQLCGACVTAGAGEGGRQKDRHMTGFPFTKGFWKCEKRTDCMEESRRQ